MFRELSMHGRGDAIDLGAIGISCANWYNSSYHSNIQMTPFEALYGYTLYYMFPYSTTNVFDTFLKIKKLPSTYYNTTYKNHKII